jgi:uncharacterized protein
MRFEWDENNTVKLEIKHRVTRGEAESIFQDVKRKITFSRMVANEMRYLCIGLSSRNKIRTAVYTIRNQAVRIISCRYANKKEIEIYEETR